MKNIVLYPWKITSSLVSSVTIRGYYHDALEKNLKKPNLRLCKGYLGKSRESLDLIDLDINLQEAVESFGAFIKYVVEDGLVGGTTPLIEQCINNAFTVLMDSQRLHCQRRCPSKIEKEKKTKKDIMYNDIISLFEEHGLKWKSSEVAGVGVSLAQALTECLWYIDGHHSAFDDQGCKIPNIFCSFTGYNVPEASKHRKRTVQNMSKDKILSIAESLFKCLQEAYWKQPTFIQFQQDVEGLANAMAVYSDYLSRKNKQVKLNHSLESPVRQLSDSLTLEIISQSKLCYPCFSDITERLNNTEPYDLVYLTELCPLEPRYRYDFIQKIKYGLNIPVVLLTFAPGNNRGNLYFIWKYSSDDSFEKIFDNSTCVVESIKPQLPVYHTRAMRKSMFAKFGRLTSAVSPATLRYFYRDLTGDNSSASNISEAEIDSRVQQLLDMEPEDPQTIVDLRSLNSSTERARYDVFWDHCSKYVNECIGAAVDDRRHSEVTHLAQAISIRDLRDQVSTRCPEGTAIPSLEWIRLQFCPKTKNAKTALHYTG